MATALATEMIVQLMRWSAQEVIEATAAQSVLSPRSARDLAFAEICIDSRRVSESSLFVALRGPSFDGHDFVAAALAAGATGAIVERVPNGVDAEMCFVVGDSLRALGDLAHFSRERSSELQVVAITGSNGKTTTKEMIASICAEATRDVVGAVLKTAGNQNNLVGLPLTLLRMLGDEAIAVLEMGMNQPGEIARLTEIARPNFGVITNVAAAHLAGLGSLDGVAAAKGELFGGMSPDGTIAVNVDDQRVVRAAERFSGKRVEFGSGADVYASRARDRGSGGFSMNLHVGGKSQRVRLSFVGLHNVENALAAAALGHAMGFSLATIVAGLEAARPAPMRMQIVELAGGATVINDSYNANPASVIAGMRSVAASARRGGRGWAVLGEMRELGGHSARFHREVGAEAARLGLAYLIAVGPQREEIAAGARSVDSLVEVVECADSATAASWIRDKVQAGDVLLVKGSRGADSEDAVRRYGSRMAEVVALLEEVTGV